VNFADRLCVEGLYPTQPEYPFVPGFEVAGVVVKRGERVREWQGGGEVIAATGQRLGGHARRVNVPVWTIARKPRGMSFEEACSVPVVFTTAHYAWGLGEVKAGERVLIQAATGGCGMAALQLGWLAGCKCYGTSSREEKLELLRRLGVEGINY